MISCYALCEHSGKYSNVKMLARTGFAEFVRYLTLPNGSQKILSL